jgi:hypothetical protein
MEKPIFRHLEDQLVEVFGRYAKRVHQGGLDRSGYLGNAGFVVPALKDVNLGERHGAPPLC